MIEKNTKDWGFIDAQTMHFQVDWVYNKHRLNNNDTNMLFFPNQQQEYQNTISNKQRVVAISINGLLSLSLLWLSELDGNPIHRTINVMIITDVVLEVADRIQGAINQGFNYLSQNGL